MSAPKVLSKLLFTTTSVSSWMLAVSLRWPKRAKLLKVMITYPGPDQRGLRDWSLYAWSPTFTLEDYPASKADSAFRPGCLIAIVALRRIKATCRDH